LDSERPLTRKKNEGLYKKLLPRKLDFVLEHRAGEKMAHVDALSRHVGAVVQGGTLEKEDVLREQSKARFVSNRTQELTLAERNIFGTTMVFCMDVGLKRTSDDRTREFSARGYYVTSRSSLCRSPG